MLQYYNPQTDLGTPAPGADIGGELITVFIDGRDVQVAAGTSVMRAAALAGTRIPKLCATDSLEAFGSCRICMVEIEGRKGYPASCTTPVEAGMQVRTQTETLARLRRNVMELYISDHPLDCLTCPTNGDCELQDVAGQVGLREVRYGFSGENHLDDPKDTSNPYFQFDPSKCIVCSRCVRACGETQGTFALTQMGRGFDSRIAPGANPSMFESDCVSCGACVAACPTASLIEKAVVETGVPEHVVETTCGYCGVGCGFRAEMRGNAVVRMVPSKKGKANEGHSCVKGRFAFSYATHKDRITTPMIREHHSDPWQEVSWDEALRFAAEKLRGIQQKYGRNSIGGITSSRCTNEETYLVQKLIRAGFGTNNVDTCARVCHSPTGFGLKTTLGESAGTQSFHSVGKSDAVMIIGSNPSDAHPVFGSRLKRRLREGAALIVMDPRRIDLLDMPRGGKGIHLQLRPGTNVAMLNALAHVVVTEHLVDEAFVAERCETDAFSAWRDFMSREEHSPEATESITGVAAERVREAARLFAGVPNAAIYYGLGVTEHSQGSTAVMGIANLAMATGNVGREGVGVNPMRGQNNVQGSCDMGSFPHEFPGYRHVSDDATRALFEQHWNVQLDNEPGMRIPNMLDAAVDGQFRGLYVQGEDIAQSDPGTLHVEAALRNLECLIVQDIFLNETALFAHVFLPGATFLEKDGTFTNAERRISRVRQAMPPLAGKQDWEITQELAKALGYAMHYRHPSEIMDEIAALTPTFSGVSYDKLDRLHSIQWPCNDSAPDGTVTMHVDGFVRGKGYFAVTPFVATQERSNRRYPLLLTTGRILSQYNVGSQTRRTHNLAWHDEDVLDLHAADAEERGIREGDWVGISSRAGDTVLRARISDKVKPGVVYTTFHHPVSGTNVVTTENSDWATNCPEYKVTAVQVMRVESPSSWQQRREAFVREQRELIAVEIS